MAEGAAPPRRARVRAPGDRAVPGHRQHPLKESPVRRWQLTGLVVGAAALLFTAGPPQAQVWIGPPAGPPPFVVGRPTPPVWPVPPVGVVPGPVGVTTLPAVVSPGWGTSPVWPVPPVGVVPPVWAVPPVGVVPGPVVVSPGWGARPRDVRRAYRAARRAGR